MKKLALALMCLVSVAFFASCTQPVDNPEPTIQVCTDAGYVQDGATVDLDTDVVFGFVMASNTQTNKELANLLVTIDDHQWANVPLNRTQYTYTDTIVYTMNREDIVGTSKITAVLTDVAGQTATAEINLNINEPSEPLIAHIFEWFRLGNTQTGLEEFGLYWEKNIKDTHAQIKPLEGVTLYTFDSSVWEATTTDVQKVAIFSDGATEISVYNNVSTTAGNDYNDVIGTKMADGTLHLIHVTKCVIDAYQDQGYPIHITGEAK